MAYQCVGSNAEWNCLDLARWIYSQAGVEFPSLATAPTHLGEVEFRTIEAQGWVVLASPSDVRNGDLLVFRYGRSPNHVGVMASFPEFIHATPRGVMADRLLPQSVWGRRWRCGFRGPWQI